MNILRYFLLVFVFSFSFLFGYMQETNASENKNVELIIGLDAKETIPYEPIFVSVKLTNGTSKPIDILNPFPKGLEFFYSFENESFKSLGYTDESALDVAPYYIKVEINKTLTATDEILFYYRSPESSKCDYVFGKPGKYRIKAKLLLEDDKRRVDSNEIEVVVKDIPIAESDAAKLITNIKVTRIINGWDFEEENAALLKELVIKYPESAYADHAYFALARYFNLQVYRKKVGEEKASLESFEAYAKVSERVPALKLRAIIRQAELGRDYSEIREKVDIAKLLDELKKRSDIAKQIGLGKEAVELQKQLEELVKVQSGK